MANKFTKSVLERQAKELKTHAVPAPATTAEETVMPANQLAAEPMPIEPPAAEIPQTPAPTKTPLKKPTQNKAIPDLADFIVRDEGRTAKNKTFYLDAAVIDGLHRAAIAQKVTDSKLVNDILRKILGL